jgi:hypothetical protein
MLLSEDARALDDLLDGAAAANDGALSPDEGAAIEQWAGELEHASADKAEAIGWLLREWCARADVRREQAKALLAQARADEARADRLRAYVLECLRRMGRTELPGTSLRLAVQKNSGKAPVALTGEIPRDYCRVVIEPDLERVRAALERGETVPGAALGERGYHLRVR